MSFERISWASGELFNALGESMEEFWDEVLQSFVPTSVGEGTAFSKDVPYSAPSLGFFEHYKWGRYEYLGIAVRESDGIPLALYRSVESGVLFARPAAEFFGKVEADGKLVPRFRKVL